MKSIKSIEKFAYSVYELANEQQKLRVYKDHLEILACLELEAPHLLVQINDNNIAKETTRKKHC